MRKFTQAEIDKATNEAPILVQEALVTDPFLDFGLNLEKNYQLHVDTVGTVADLMYELLIGLINPSEFVTGLQEAGIPPATAQQVTKDLNDKVFMPLQEKMKNGGNKGPDEPSQLIPTSPPRKQEASAAPVVTPSVTSTSTAPLPYVPPAPAPAPFTPAVAPIVPRPIPPVPPGPSIPAPRPIAPPAIAPMEEPEMRTMASDMEMVKSGGFHEALVTPIPQASVSMPASAGTPIVRAPSAPVPTAQPTQASQPTTLPPQTQSRPGISAGPAIAAMPPVMPKAPAPQSENREALHEILKSYGVDPYREPPE